MLLESVSSAAKKAEELYNNINENKIGMETLNRIEDHFTGMYQNNHNLIYIYSCCFSKLELYKLILSEVMHCSSEFKVH